MMYNDEETQALLPAAIPINRNKDRKGGNHILTAFVCIISLSLLAVMVYAYAENGSTVVTTNMLESSDGQEWSNSTVIINGKTFVYCDLEGNKKP